MTNDGDGRERRRCRRFRVRDGVVYLDSLVGEVIDVSFGGLAFRYVSAAGTRAEASLESGVLFGGEEIFLENVTLRTVSDFVLACSGEEEEVRRRGMAFGPLTPEELAALARFIRLFARDREEGEGGPPPVP